jgi:hypothetical protein
MRTPDNGLQNFAGDRFSATVSLDG